MVTVENWNQEYNSVQSIPSSIRYQPSQTLQNLFSKVKPSGNLGVSLGCGNGRNLPELSEYTDSVIGIDFSVQALQLSENNKLSDEQIIQAKIPEIPIQDSKVDIIVDSYFSCHFTDAKERSNYFKQLERITVPDAKLYWIGVGKKDEYYQQYTNTKFVLDVKNNIAKRLYTLEELQNGFNQNVTPIYTDRITFKDVVNGEEYKRDILVGVFKV